MGADGSDAVGGSVGEPGVFYGPLTESLSMADADRTIMGEASGDKLSDSSLGGRGDVDGDGLDDILLGSTAHSSRALDGGAVYLVLGDEEARGTLEAVDAELRIYGAEAEGNLGYGLDLADLDGDGQSDVVASAWFAWDVKEPGAAFVFYGPVEGAFTTDEADAPSFQITGTYEACQLPGIPSMKGPIGNDHGRNRSDPMQLQV